MGLEEIKACRHKNAARACMPCLRERIAKLEARLSDEIWWAGERQKKIDALLDALRGAVPFDQAAKEKIEAALRAKGDGAE